MAYTDQYALSKNATFLQKIEVAIVTAAVNIQAESAATVNHGSRAQLAVRVLNNPTGYAVLFADAVCQNAAIVTGSTDADIQFTVNSVWDAMAVGA